MSPKHCCGFRFRHSLTRHLQRAHADANREKLVSTDIRKSNCTLKRFEPGKNGWLGYIRNDIAHAVI